jgi:hypothetical protein
MAIIKVSKTGALGDITVVAAELKADCIHKLRKFSIESLMENKIIGRIKDKNTAINTFNLDSNTGMNKRRLISKVMSSIMSIIVKRMPFLERGILFNEASVNTYGSIVLKGSLSRQDYSMKDVRGFITNVRRQNVYGATDEEVYNYFCKGPNNYTEFLLSRDRYNRSIERYLRWINKACRNNGLPIAIILDPGYITISPAPDPLSNNDTIILTIDSNRGITIQLVNWGPDLSNNRDHMPLESQRGYNSASVYKCFLFISSFIKILQTLRRGGTFDVSSYTV